MSFSNSAKDHELDRKGFELALKDAGLNIENREDMAKVVDKIFKAFDHNETRMHMTLFFTFFSIYSYEKVTF